MRPSTKQDCSNDAESLDRSRGSYVRIAQRAECIRGRALNGFGQGGGHGETCGVGQTRGGDTSVREKIAPFDPGDREDLGSRDTRRYHRAGDRGTILARQ